jgi:hypothetical protein
VFLPERTDIEVFQRRGHVHLQPFPVVHTEHPESFKRREFKVSPTVVDHILHVALKLPLGSDYFVRIILVDFWDLQFLQRGEVHDDGSEFDQIFVLEVPANSERPSDDVKRAEIWESRK